MVLRTVAAAAASDTWGISGPDFIRFYVTAGVIAVAYGVVWRAGVQCWPRPLRSPAKSLRPSETAMLVNYRLPVMSAVAQLRGHELIDADGEPLDTPGGTEQRDLDPLSRELYAYLSTHSKRSVTDMLDGTLEPCRTLREDLTARGYLFGDTRRNILWAGLIPLPALVVLGVVRLFAGLEAHHPVGFLAISLIVLAAVTWALAYPPRLTLRGRSALTRSRMRNRHLSPDKSPAYSAYGPDSAALAVALFGGFVLWNFDPALAGAIEPAHVWTGAYGGYSGGSFGSGGGGGGCGGGGG
ncbi:TIGR04222 domain-containing membrane protein, partial [Nocardia sp. JMUB6875]|uniref:TIGR04222 domain-containing membrane protein n=1 Tax=Nocardia sp. JMUB6875 TaxID=3158170 RepID=UPI0034E8F838